MAHELVHARMFCLKFSPPYFHLPFLLAFSFHSFNHSGSSGPLEDQFSSIMASGVYRICWMLGCLCILIFTLLSFLSPSSIFIYSSVDAPENLSHFDHFMHLVSEQKLLPWPPSLIMTLKREARAKLPLYISRAVQYQLMHFPILFNHK